MGKTIAGLIAISIVCPCAAIAQEVDPIALPTEAEVAIFVEDHEGELDARFDTSLEGKSGILVGYSDILCQTNFAWSECSAQLTYQLSDGQEIERARSWTFDRDEEGNLRSISIIVLVHERRSPVPDPSNISLTVVPLDLVVAVDEP